jgi:hypothetical protein
VVKRAKGVLLRRVGGTKEEVYRRLRKYASDRNLKLADAAGRPKRCSETSTGETSPPVRAARQSVPHGRGTNDGGWAGLPAVSPDPLVTHNPPRPFSPGRPALRRTAASRARCRRLPRAEPKAVEVFPRAVPFF